MPAKRKNMKGKGIVTDGLKFIRDQKLLSKGLGLIPHPYAQIGSLVADQLGLGKRKRKVKRKMPMTMCMPQHMVGKGIFSDIGGGLGSALGGLGSGVGSIAHGLFGSGKMMKGKGASKKMPCVLLMKR